MVQKSMGYEAFKKALKNQSKKYDFQRCRILLGSTPAAARALFSSV